MTDISSIDLYRQQAIERQALLDAGAAEEVAAIVAMLRMRARQARIDVAAAATRLAEHCASVATSVAQGYTINSLGEIQGRGMDLDRLCIQHNERVEAATWAAWPYADALEGMPLWPTD